ncbi:MAG: carbohydrate-binding domain-containing protein [Lachnospiraceae bacterium]|nr:carbohydrate-binding domain-containing protein [Lachnospiraceae bacterium]
MSLAVALILSGCGDGAASRGSASVDNKEGAGQELGQADKNEAGQGASAGNEISMGNNNIEGSSSIPLTADDIFSDRDFETDYDESESAVITLNGSSAECSLDAVEINGSTVTIKDEGTYILSGNLDDGMIIVDSDKEDKTQLVLKGVNIHSKTSAPIYILQSDKVFVTLAEGTENSLSNGGVFTAIDDNNIDAVIFSKEDLTLNGEGSLKISSPAGHGIVSKDELALTGGSYDITCGSHGLSGKDGVGIAGGTYHITSGKDGIHGENDEDSALGYVYLKDGVINIKSEDDGISAVSRLQVDGGTINIASVDDAFHADDTLAVNAGTLNISESYEGLEGLYVEINGGTIALVAEDDGINAAGGNDSSGFGGKGGNDMFGGKGAGDWFGGRGGRGGKQRGEMGEASGEMFGEKPQLPEGMPENMQGVAPEMPEGMPENMPEMPGNMPQDMKGGMPGSSGSGSISITGGEIYVKASGDGIDANGSLTISGGNITVCGPNHGDTATLDYDTTGVITGGTFVGSGARGMAQTFSDSTQGVVTAHVGSVAAGTEVTLADKNGKVLINYTPELDCSVMIFSSPELVKGEMYSLSVGGVQSDCMAE